jgi:hypothetical protein
VRTPTGRCWSASPRSWSSAPSAERPVRVPLSLTSTSNDSSHTPEPDADRTPHAEQARIERRPLLLPMRSSGRRGAAARRPSP